MKSDPDYFAVLGLERRAALDPEAVKEAFHALSRSAHPDAGGGAGVGAEEFEVAGEAYRRLADPVLRLKHLLELEFPGADKNEARGMISGELLELFGRIGEAMQNADAVLRKKAEATTALGRAVIEPEALASQEVLQRLGAQVHAEIESAETRFAEVDAMLVSHRDAAADLGGVLARQLSFLTKWRDQIREKTVAFI